MNMIDRKCNTYLLSVEHTNSVVDVTPDGLRKEIFALIEPLRSSEHLMELGVEDMGAVLLGVEQHANTQKFIIQRLLVGSLQSFVAFRNALCDVDIVHFAHCCVMIIAGYYVRRTNDL